MATRKKAREHRAKAGKPGVSIITCTGDRQIPFSLLERWVADQVWTGDIDWIVVDDGKTPTKCTMGQRYVRREPRPDDPPHTLNLNLLTALDANPKYDMIGFMEDDDHYGPGFIQSYAVLLNNATIVGEARSRYYWLPSKKWWWHPNLVSCSLAQTMVRGEHIDLIRTCATMVPHNSYIDKRFWTTVMEYGVGRPFVAIDWGHSYGWHVSMKGFTGRRGLDDGHNPKCGAYRDDDEKLTVLRKWIKNREHVDLILDAISDGGQPEDGAQCPHAIGVADE